MEASTEAFAVPTFETERLTIRQLVAEDALAYERHFRDYEVVRALSAKVPWPYPKGGIPRYLETEILPLQGKNKWVWAIALKEAPAELIGVIDLWRHAQPDNRGFWLGREFWGKGYMTEALEPVTNYAFDELGFEKLVFTNAAGNSRSGRIKDKTGARFLGRIPGQFVDPSFTEQEVYELTREDWRNRGRV